jgi:uncharacterized protein
MTIIASALWRRIDAPGHDACRLEKNESGWTLRGAAVFRLGDAAANLSYAVRCDREWQTLSGRILGVIGERPIAYRIAREDSGFWVLNGDSVPDLERLGDLDLSFTPATNLLQIRRVALPVGQAVSLPAAWFNLEAGALTALEQVYERRSELTLYYRAPNVGYEGLLELAPNGFIRRYPGLWEAELTRPT